MQLFTPVAQISQQSDYWIDLQRGNWDRLQRLLPMKRAHTEVEHDVQVHPCCHGSGTFFHWAFKLLFLSPDREEFEKAFGNNDGGYRFLAAMICCLALCLENDYMVCS